MADPARIGRGGNPPPQGDRAAIRRPKQDPCRYPVGDHPGVRELPCVGHRVMYRLDPDTNRGDPAGDVLVLRVFGPGQSRDQL